MIARVDALAGYLEGQVRDFAEVAVVGLSGGIDSAVVASICVEVLGAKNVYLVSMPYDEIDVTTFNLRSAELAEGLKANHFVVPIAPSCDALSARVKTCFGKKLTSTDADLHRQTLGNVRARTRMSVLYAVAGEITYRSEEKKHPHPHVIPVIAPDFIKRVRVIGTGNASEDLIGYDTKGGDALADLFVIGELFKSEVYQLANYYEISQSIISAVPSAGLYPGQTDHVELGYSYEELEPALSALFRVINRGVADSDITANLHEFVELDSKIANFVIERFRANAHKHRAPKVVEIRKTNLVKDIWAT